VLRIRVFDPWDEMGKKSGSGSGIRIRDEQPRSYFRELRNNFWVKILKFLNADPSGIRYPESFPPGIREGKKSDPR
jgi:hypothetical protein